MRMENNLQSRTVPALPNTGYYQNDQGSKVVLCRAPTKNVK